MNEPQFFSFSHGRGSLLFIALFKGNLSIMKGFHFPLESWDGCDFFSPEGSGKIIVNERVKNLFKKHNITNVVFQDLEEEEWI